MILPATQLLKGECCRLLTIIHSLYACTVVRVISYNTDAAHMYVMICKRGAELWMMDCTNWFSDLLL